MAGAAQAHPLPASAGAGGPYASSHCYVVGPDGGRPPRRQENRFPEENLPTVVQTGFDPGSGPVGQAAHHRHAFVLSQEVPPQAAHAEPSGTRASSLAGLSYRLSLRAVSMKCRVLNSCAIKLKRLNISR